MRIIQRIKEWNEERELKNFIGFLDDNNTKVQQFIQTIERIDRQTKE